MPAVLRTVSRAPSRSRCFTSWGWERSLSPLVRAWISAAAAAWVPLGTGAEAPRAAPLGRVAETAGPAREPLVRGAAGGPGSSGRSSAPGGAGAAAGAGPVGRCPVVTGRPAPGRAPAELGSAIPRRRLLFCLQGLQRARGERVLGLRVQHLAQPALGLLGRLAALLLAGGLEAALGVEEAEAK